MKRIKFSGQNGREREGEILTEWIGPQDKLPYCEVVTDKLYEYEGNNPTFIVALHTKHYNHPFAIVQIPNDSIWPGDCPVCGGSLEICLAKCEDAEKWGER
jgi:hypothetical protein